MRGLRGLVANSANSCSRFPRYFFMGSLSFFLALPCREDGWMTRAGGTGFDLEDRRTDIGLGGVFCRTLSEEKNATYKAQSTFTITPFMQKLARFWLTSAYLPGVYLSCRKAILEKKFIQPLLPGQSFVSSSTDRPENARWCLH